MSSLKIPVEGFELASHPRLKLFLSADIVGSTAFKQPLNFALFAKDGEQPTESDDKDRPGLSSWSDIIQGFYSKFSEFLADEWNEYGLCLDKHNASHERERWMGDRPRLWKTIGDEVIFWKVLRHDVQLPVALACWIKVVQKVRAWLKSRGTSLDIKCTAWLAEFPVRNRAVWSDNLAALPLRRAATAPTAAAATDVLPDPAVETDVTDESFAMIKNRKSDYTLEELNNFYRAVPYRGVVDFIGPGIDIGFRISQWATAQRFIVSLDLAYVLSLVLQPGKRGTSQVASPMDSIPPIIAKVWFSPRDKSDQSLLRIYFDKTDFLKGVLGGFNYPRFWLNIEQSPESLAQLESFLIPQAAKITYIAANRVRDYCRAYYREQSAFLMEPFINSSESVTELPESYRDYLSSIASRSEQAQSG